MRRHFRLLRIRHEACVELVAELRVERPAVDHKGNHAAHVPDEPLPPQREVLGVLGPPRVLAGEATEQLVGGVHLPLHGRGAVLERLHFGLRFSELSVKDCHLVQHLLQLRVRHGELGLRLLQPSLSDLQRIHLGRHDLRSEVVLNHRAHELAQAFGSRAGAQGLLWREHFPGPRAPILLLVLVVPQVWLQQLARLVIDVVLLVGSEVENFVQEADVVQFLLGVLVRVHNECSLDLVDHGVRIRLDVDHWLRLQNLQAVEGQLDDVHRVLVGLQVPDVLLGDRVAGLLGLVQKRQGLVQLHLRLSLLFGDPVGSLFAVCLLRVDQLLLLVGLGLLALHLHEQLRGLLLLHLEYHLLLLELHLELLNKLGCLFELLQPHLHTPLLHVDFVVLRLVQNLVEINQAQKAFGGHVGVLAHTRVVQLTHVSDRGLERACELVEALAVLCRGVHLERRKELGAHCHQRIFWPRHEPVDVYGKDCRELLCADGELRVHWGET
mmetsp:Transcript_29947/g.85560  ORF Transcript_29947/g.85560 Transcript_29947/m.85560 type:complete len:495 (-) Transcript_29947:370-1854(-)